MDIDSTVKKIRKDFFAHRNGVVADTLRRSGDPHTMIMGCQLADVVTMAREIEPSAQLAQELWEDRRHRECRMIAPMLYPAQEFDIDKALAWSLDVESNEIADVLCHRLLRQLDFAQALLRLLLGYDSPQVRYTAFRLLLNIVLIGNVELNDSLRALVENELQVAPSTLKPIITSILEEF